MPSDACPIAKRLDAAVADALLDGDPAEATDEARRVLVTLIGGLSPLPHLSVNGPTVLAEWRRGGRDLLLWVSGQGKARLQRVTVGPPATVDSKDAPTEADVAEALAWLEEIR